MIKSISNLSLSELARSIWLTKVFHFTSLKANSKTFYPYAFGGLKKVNLDENNVTRIMITQYFGQETSDGFKEAYKSFLCSLVQKDQQTLKQILEPSIFDRLKLKNVELINPNADIDIIYGDLHFIIGGGIDRNKYEYAKMGSSIASQNKENQTARQYIQRNLYAGNLITSQKKGLSSLSQTPPILMAFNILFRSSMKLIPEGGSRENTAQQIHSLQFELQGKLNITPFNIIKTYLRIVVGGFFKPFQVRKKLFEQIIGQNYQWKIADIDQLLNKNLNLIEE